MRSFKAVLIFGYLFLSCWWLVINLDNISNHGKLYFCLGLAAYFIVLSGWLAIIIIFSKNVLRLKTFGLLTSSGSFLFGLCFLSTFCYGISNTAVTYSLVPFIFYLFQFPFYVFGLIKLLEKKGSLLKFLIFSIVIFIISYVYSQRFWTFNFQSFLLVYFPIKSLSLIVILTAISIYKKQKINLFLLFFGLLIWFLGDVLFSSSENVFNLVLTNYSDLLYLSAVFTVFLGVSRLFNENSFTFLDKSKNIVSLRTAPYQAPFSLNSLLKFLNN